MRVRLNAIGTTPAAVESETIAPHVDALPDPKFVNVEPSAPLESRWPSDRAPRITTAEIPASIDALFSHSIEIGLFDLSTRDMNHQSGIGERGRLEVMAAPNRRAALAAQTHVAKPDVSVLLDPPNPDQRGLSWRGYLLWPNIFPYFPIETQQTVIVAATAKPQHFSTAVLTDMFDYQAGAGRNVTMLYNGMAGNSQHQLHWHALKHQLPIHRLLDDGALETTTKVRETVGRVSTFEDGFYGGVLIEGTRAFVSARTATIVDGLETKTPTLGAYNLLILPPHGDRVRMVAIPRVAGIKQRQHGAISMSGTLLIQDPPPVDLEEFESHARSQLVVPSDLPWLDAALDKEKLPQLQTL